MNSPQNPSPRGRDEYRIGWVCALSKEQTVAMAMLEEIHPDLLNLENDPNAYTLGSIGGHNIVIACLPHGRTGNNPAATVVAKMVSAFPNVKVGLMVGIGGGIPPTVRLGDVVVSTPGEGYPGVVQWDLGKTEDGGRFKHTGSLDRPPMSLSTAVSKLSSLLDMGLVEIRPVLDEVADKYPKLATRYTRSPPCSNPSFPRYGPGQSQGILTSPVLSGTGEETETQNSTNIITGENLDDVKIHYGLIASGNQVIKNEGLRNHINSQFRGHVLCVEMEAAGVMDNFPCLVIRGICDYADSRKNDDWQEYAATVAAAYAKKLLQNLQPEVVDREESIKPMLSKLSKTVDNLEEATQNLGSWQRDHDKVNILNWLTPIDFGRKQSDTLDRVQPGTGQWLIDDAKFCHWKNTIGRTLFCPGIPGAGKTFLTSIVINHLENLARGRNIGIAYAYCSFNPQNKQTATELLTSLLRQLSDRLPGLPETVRQLYDKHQKSKSKPQLSETVETLRAVAMSFSQVFILIDALDEFRDGEQAKENWPRFLMEIFDLQNKAKVNVFVTSRKLSKIVESFGDTTTLEIRATDEDVREYIKENMAMLHDFVQRDDKLEEKITTWVINSADGMFLIANLLLCSLRDKITQQEIEDAVKKPRDGMNPYDSAYMTAMERVEAQSSSLKNLAKQTISWIVCAKRPLTPKALQHALAVKPGTKKLNAKAMPDLKDMVLSCVGLVAIDLQSDVIRLVHFTAQEYFESHLQEWVQDSQTRIAQTCVTYLSFDIIEDPGVVDLRYRWSEGQWDPFYEYAADFWGDHARMTPVLYPEVVELLKSDHQVQLASLCLMRDETEHPEEKFDFHEFLTTTHSTISKPGTTWQYNGIERVEMSGLHLSGYFGIEYVAEALSKTTDINNEDTWDRTALSYAAERGHELCVRAFLKNPATELKDLRWQSPIFYASRNKHRSIVNELLQTTKHDVAYNQKLFMAAINLGEELIVEELLNLVRVDTNSRDDDGLTPLLKASRGGYQNIIARLLDKGKVDVHVQDRCGRKALDCAASNGHATIVAKYLNKKPFVESDENPDLEGLLRWAAGSRTVGRKWNVVVVLLENGLNPNVLTLGYPLLCGSAEDGDLGTVEKLLDVGAAINIRDHMGKTPLSWAAEKGHADIVAKLIDSDLCEVSAPDKEGRTPLILAAKEGYCDVTRRLLSASGVGVEIRDFNGFRASSWATTQDNASVVELLFTATESRASVDDMSKDDVFLAAAWLGREETVKELLETRKTGIDAPNPNGESPLMLAVRRQHEGTVRVLLSSGEVNILQEDRDRFTPYLEAVKSTSETIRQLLKTHFQGLYRRKVE